VRPDLVALTDEVLVRLANVGLVKRAQKELAAGTRPGLVEEADGTVVALAKDGATTRLIRGVPLQQSACTCGSSTVCRHRIAAVLAYRELHATAGLTASAPEPAWDPGAFSDEAVLACCGAPLVARAEAAIAKGIVATVRPGDRTADGAAIAPSVALPTANVQFLVPDDLAYAKCDCARGHACEHVVLAVRAFRVGHGVVTIGSSPTVTVATVSTAARGVLVETLAYVAQQGLAAPGTAAMLANARAAAERERWWWIVDGLESVERLADAYQRQSARFQVEALAREVGELVARMRASASSASGFPPSWLLGSDQAPETAMEQVRLLALGARLDADDDRRMARVYFADPDTASVLVLEKTWVGEKRNGPELGQLFASSRMSLADLARGELVTRAARRRANGALDLGAARGMKSSLLPSSGSWARLPEPLLVRDLAAHAARRRSQPPSCLSPRGLGNEVAVVEIARVIDVDVPSDRQSVTGMVDDPRGNRLIVHAEYRKVSPGAVDATEQALGATPTHVAGELRRTPDGWGMNPLAFLGKELVVTDLQPQGRRTGARADATTVVSAASPSADVRLASVLRDYVGRTLLLGARATASTATRLARDAENYAADRLASSLVQAASGSPQAVLDLAVLHQLDD
jgi:hypothetical protein